jgi:hypothetical protein
MTKTEKENRALKNEAAYDSSTVDAYEEATIYVEVTKLSLSSERLECTYDIQYNYYSGLSEAAEVLRYYGPSLACGLIEIKDLICQRKNIHPKNLSSYTVLFNEK